MTNKERTVCIDYGLARIGFARSDEQKMLASPLETMKAEKKLEATIKKVHEFLEKDQKEMGYKIDTIIVGMPLMMNGTKGHFADEVNDFVERLRTLTDIPVVTWDERLSSVQADRSMREGFLTRKRRAQSVDAVAAVIILQSFLDSR